MDFQAETLLSNASATGSAKVWRGGTGVFKAVATWGGGTVKLQYLGPDATTWVDAGSDTTLTANGGGQFNLPAGTQVRASVATATAVYATVESARPDL